MEEEQTPPPAPVVDTVSTSTSVEQMYHVRKMRPRQRLPRPTALSPVAGTILGQVVYFHLQCGRSSACGGSGGKRGGGKVALVRVSSVMGIGASEYSSVVTSSFLFLIASFSNDRFLGERVAPTSLPHRFVQAYEGKDRCWYASALQLQLASLG